jgi:hypothetical protein
MIAPTGARTIELPPISHSFSWLLALPGECFNRRACAKMEGADLPSHITRGGPMRTDRTAGSRSANCAPTPVTTPPREETILTGTARNLFDERYKKQCECRRIRGRS